MSYEQVPLDPAPALIEEVGKITNPDDAYEVVHVGITLPSGETITVKNVEDKEAAIRQIPGLSEIGTSQEISVQFEDLDSENVPVRTSGREEAAQLAIETVNGKRISEWIDNQLPKMAERAGEEPIAPIEPVSLNK